MNSRELKRLAEWKYDDIFFSLAASADATTLWFGSSDSGVYQLDLATENPQRRKLDGEGHTSYVTGMVRTGQTLATCGYDRRLIWWDLQSGQQARSIQAHDQWIRNLIATPAGDRLVTVADDMRCRVWDSQSAELIADFSDHPATTPHHYPSMLYAVAISDDGGRLATGDRTGHVAIWDATRFQKIGQLEAPKMYTWDPTKRRHSIGGIRSLSFSPDGSKLAVGGMGQVGNIDHLQGPSRLDIFDVASGDRLLEIEDGKKKGLIEQIVWSKQGDWIVTAGGAHNGFITVYDANSGKQIHTADQGGHVHAFVHDDEWQHIFVAGHQRISHWSYLPRSG